MEKNTLEAEVLTPENIISGSCDAEGGSFNNFGNFGNGPRDLGGYTVNADAYAE